MEDSRVLNLRVATRLLKQWKILKYAKIFISLVLINLIKKSV